MNIEDPLQENCIATIKQIKFKKWHTKITIIIKDFTLTTTTLIDTGANLNCVQEGLIPSRYYNKTKERLCSTNESRMDIRYEISKSHICHNNICFRREDLEIIFLKH